MTVKKNKECLFIVHFNPLELYPPVMNAIHYLENVMAEKKIFVITTAAADLQNRFNPVKDSTIVIRLGKTGKWLPGIIRLLSYLHFYGTGLLLLIIKRPAAVLYFETFSAFAPIWYKKYFNPGVRLYIHYHEYMTLKEYRHGSALIRYLHKLEEEVYPEVSSVSHTNEKRMQLFLEDNNSLVFRHTDIIPNYPPGNWMKREKPADRLPSAVVKVVYAGALNMDNMYTREFAIWIQQQNGKVTWDIYSLNMDKQSGTFLAELNCPYINVYPGVYYYQLPVIFSNYDVGVILYKGASDNHVYSVSNKFFEYHVCGLDIWFPREIVTTLAYTTCGTYPKIISLDYSSIGQLNADELTDRKGLTYRQFTFNCENALAPLAKELQF